MIKELSYFLKTYLDSPLSQANSTQYILSLLGVSPSLIPTNQNGMSSLIGVPLFACIGLNRSHTRTSARLVPPARPKRGQTVPDESMPTQRGPSLANHAELPDVIAGILVNWMAVRVLTSQPKAFFCSFLQPHTHSLTVVGSLPLVALRVLYLSH